MPKRRAGKAPTDVFYDETALVSDSETEEVAPKKNVSKKEPAKPAKGRKRGRKSTSSPEKTASTKDDKENAVHQVETNLTSEKHQEKDVNVETTEKKFEKAASEVSVETLVSVDTLVPPKPPKMPLDKEAYYQKLPRLEDFKSSSTTTSSRLMQLNRRRSSFSLRGKRKSSYGEIQSVLHADIPPEDFAKHVSTDLPDPVRLRQIMIYAMEREIRNMGIEKNNKVGKLVKQCLETALGALLKKKLNTSWYHRPQDEVILVTKPNPENIELERRIRGYEEVIDRLKRQEQKWIQVQNHIQNYHAPLEIFPVPDALTAGDIDQFNIDDGRKEKIKSALFPGNKTHGELLDSSRQNVVSMLNEIQEKTTSLHQTLHALTAMSCRESEALERRFAKALEACWSDDSKPVDQIILGPAMPKTPKKKQGDRVVVIRGEEHVIPVEVMESPRDETMTLLKVLSKQ